MRTFVFYYLLHNETHHTDVDSFALPRGIESRVYDQFGIRDVDDDPIWGGRSRNLSPTKYEVKRGSFSAENWVEAEKIIATSQLQLLFVFNIFTPTSRLLVHYLDYYFATDYIAERSEKGTFVMDPVFFYYDYYDKVYLKSDKLIEEKGLDNLGLFKDHTLFQHYIKIFSNAKL